ncbi:Hemin transport protein [Luteimonas sp. SMYT11W]|uniref:Hemin transport protein n=1 Tax=Luteimonas flava TaxID=3115822 RepID=A0ABU7WGN8_9GAMM
MATALSPSIACVVPTPSQLAALGTVLCLHRPGAARELGGWSSARRAEAHAGLDLDGMHESLRFFDADDACCWQLHLLPDSDFLAWERLAGNLPRCSDVAPGGIGERLWRGLAQRIRGLAQRIRGGAWEASVLRFQAVPAALEEGGPMLVASLGTLSPLGIDCARRIARGNGIAPSSSLDDCCCRRAAAAASIASPDAYRHPIPLS